MLFAILLQLVAAHHWQKSATRAQDTQAHSYQMQVQQDVEIRRANIMTLQRVVLHRVQQMQSVLLLQHNWHKSAKVERIQVHSNQVHQL